MATFAERVAQARTARENEQAAEHQRILDEVQANRDATVAQLKKLIRSEIDITDEIPEPTLLTLDEGTLAMVSMDNFWFALPVTAAGGTDTKLLGLVHCPNGHVLHKESPITTDDDWEKTLIRIDDAQAIYANTINCPYCVAARAIPVPPYQAKQP